MTVLGAAAAPPSNLARCGKPRPVGHPPAGRGAPGGLSRERPGSRRYLRRQSPPTRRPDTALVESVLSAWGELNILVNNAGVAHRGPTHEMTGDQWNQVLAVNLMAPIQLVREFLPTLQSNEAHILNVCSIFGLVSTRKAAAYQTSKFGLVGLSAALRAEYGSSRFGVTALCPGFVHTRLVDELDTREAEKLPEWMFTELDTIAAAAIQAIRRNKGIVVVTALMRALWLLGRLSPAFVDWLNRRGWRAFGWRRLSSHPPG